MKLNERYELKRTKHAWQLTERSGPQLKKKKIHYYVTLETALYAVLEREIDGQTINDVIKNIQETREEIRVLIKKISQKILQV